jgi:hypothetical protein
VDQVLPDHTDSEAMRGDWETVGKDIHSATRQMARPTLHKD